MFEEAHKVNNTDSIEKLLKDRISKIDKKINLRRAELKNEVSAMIRQIEYEETEIQKKENAIDVECCDMEVPMKQMFDSNETAKHFREAENILRETQIKKAR